jgi:hypothetical protein
MNDSTESNVVDFPLPPKNKGGRPSGAAKRAKAKALHDRQWLYVQWLSVPPDHRDPKSQKEFAKMIGVTDETLRAWKMDPRISEAVRRTVLEAAGDPSRVSRVMDILFDRIESSSAAGALDMKAVDTFLKAAGVADVWRKADTVEVHLDQSQDVIIGEMSDEELQEAYDRAAAAHEELRNERRASKP